MRQFQQERAIYDVTELIESVMRDRGVTRSELAKKLGKSKGWVTQLLDGEANKTIRTVADVLTVLGHELCTRAQPIRVGNRGSSSDTLPDMTVDSGEPSRGKFVVFVESKDQARTSRTSSRTVSYDSSLILSWSGVTAKPEDKEELILALISDFLGEASAQRDSTRASRLKRAFSWLEQQRKPLRKRL
jgi:transcriptional regulator with XRE-family HTH domain